MTTPEMERAGFTVEEQVISRLTDVFDVEGVGIGATICALIAAQLAKALYRPDLVLVTAPDPHTGFDIPPGPLLLNQAFGSTKQSVATSDWSETFHLVSAQKYVVVMGPPQIDRRGACNISRFGPDWTRPKVQLTGSRGAPDDAVRLERLHYHIRTHTPRSFVDRVDFRSTPGDGPERDTLGRPTGQTGTIISDLGVFTVNRERETLEVESLHLGVDFDTVQARTGFELIRPTDCPVTEPPTAAELDWIRNRIDPLELRRIDTQGMNRELLLELCEAEQRYWDVEPAAAWKGDFAERLARLRAGVS